MIGDIPKVWKVKKLGNISNIQAGGTPSRSKQEYWKTNPFGSRYN